MSHTHDIEEEWISLEHSDPDVHVSLQATPDMEPMICTPADFAVQLTREEFEHLLMQRLEMPDHSQQRMQTLTRPSLADLKNALVQSRRLESFDFSSSVQGWLESMLRFDTRLQKHTERFIQDLKREGRLRIKRIHARSNRLRQDTQAAKTEVDQCRSSVQTSVDYAHSRLQSSTHSILDAITPYIQPCLVDDDPDVQQVGRAFEQISHEYMMEENISRASAAAIDALQKIEIVPLPDPARQKELNDMTHERASRFLEKIEKEMKHPSRDTNRAQSLSKLHRAIATKVFPSNLRTRMGHKARELIESLRLVQTSGSSGSTLRDLDDSLETTLRKLREQAERDISTDLRNFRSFLCRLFSNHVSTVLHQLRSIGHPPIPHTAPRGDTKPRFSYHKNVYPLLRHAFQQYQDGLDKFFHSIISASVMVFQKISHEMR